jgi:hypothetical protein
MIFSPRVGLHENVAVLDYENEYSNLILKHNLSLEQLFPGIINDLRANAVASATVSTGKSLLRSRLSINPEYVPHHFQ